MVMKTNADSSMLKKINEDQLRVYHNSFVFIKKITFKKCSVF